MATGLALGGYAARAMRSLDLGTVDARFSVRGVQKPPSNIVVVGVDSTTFQVINKQWPFPRAVDAKVLNRITAGHPAAVGFDIVFADASSLGEKDDVALLTALGNANGRDVLSFQETDSRATSPVRPGADAEGPAPGRRSARKHAVPVRSRRLHPSDVVLDQPADDLPNGHRGGGHGQADPAVHRNQMDRLRRAARHVPHGVVRQRVRRQDPAQLLQGQDRGDRADRALAPGPAPRPRPTRRCPAPRSRPTRSTPSCAASRSPPCRAGSTSS